MNLGAFLFCYLSKNLSMSPTASSFFLSMILAYISVVDMRECPSSLLVVYMSAPSVSIIVAKVCLKQCTI